MNESYSTPEEAEAAAIEYAEENGLIEFDGMNCNDYGSQCFGWDGTIVGANVVIVESLGTSRRILMAVFTL